MAHTLALQVVNIAAFGVSIDGPRKRAGSGGQDYKVPSAAPSRSASLKLRTTIFSIGLSIPGFPNRLQSVKTENVQPKLTVENTMKYVCLSYLGPINWETMSESDRKASMEEFFAYEAEMRKNGHIVGGEGLQNARNAATLRSQNGKIIITDGPYAETKEQLAGFWIIEARDLNHAIQLMSRNPAVRGGAIEVRPAVDHSKMEHQTEQAPGV